MSSSVEFGTIFDKYPPGITIHLVHARRSFTCVDRSVWSEDESQTLLTFLAWMEDLRIYAKTHGIRVVEVEAEEGDVYGAQPGDLIMTAGCFGDMCVPTHTNYLNENDIIAVQEPALCLIL